MENIDFSNANLIRANFSDSVLKNVCFDHAVLSDTIFTNTTLVYPSFNGTVVDKKILQDVTIIWKLNEQNFLSRVK